MLSVCKRTRMGRGDFCLSLDIIVEILKKLPSKSLVRFRSVSKEWLNIINSRRDFIESIVTRSLSSHPPLKLPIFIFHHSVPETFFTVSPVFSPTTDHVVTIPRPSHPCTFHYQYSRGLICCSSSESHLVTIYNPTTRQLFPLPEIQTPPTTRSGLSSCFFGYDPITNQYKVLSIVVNCDERKQTYHVFTLGRREQQSWRIVKGIDEESCPDDYSVCIDGTIYYNASRQGGATMLLSFNIRSERFDRVLLPEAFLAPLYHQRLVNRLGKLGCIICNSRDTSIWIMDDAEKQEWSRTILCLPNYPVMWLGADVDTFSGVTPAGEIYATQCKYFFDKSLYVYYYDMNQNSFRRVHIEGGVRYKPKKHRYCVEVFAIHDHVENTMSL
ncbi:hypothetical protein N665_2121s0003 [Sinapis alba]|nr:hypothetical protein N665_2121s0003 [Sinapis alba]